MTRLQIVGLLLGIVALAVISSVPSALRNIEGYGARPAYAAGVTALMAIWWLTEALPIAWTACVPLVLFPVFGVFGKGPAGDLLASAAPFTDAYIFLFLGGMAIGAAMEQQNLHRRIALIIMRAIGTNPKRLLLGMLLATSSISLWISNTATAVMMLPIALALITQLERASGGRRLSYFGSSLMLAVAYAANVGGVGSKIGTGTNSIFCGFVLDELGIDIGFLQYMLMGLPFVVLFTPILWMVLWARARHDKIEGDAGREVIERELAALGPMTRSEKKVSFVFLLAAFFWVFGSPIRAALKAHGLPIQGKHYESLVAMSALVLLLLIAALSFKRLRGIPWGTLVLLGGSFAMAAGIEGSGLSVWMAQRLALIVAMPLAGQITLASFSSVLLSAVASNTATINIALNVLPRRVPVLLAAALGASCDFALPAGTPPNAIVFGSGYIRLPVMMKTGILLDFTAATLISGYAYLYARHIL